MTALPLIDRGYSHRPHAQALGQRREQERDLEVVALLRGADPLGHRAGHGPEPGLRVRHYYAADAGREGRGEPVAAAPGQGHCRATRAGATIDRKSTRLNSS